MKTCEDCGTRMYSGICSNCQEELYLVENQSDGITEPLSQEFLAKVDEQKQLLEDRKNR